MIEILSENKQSDFDNTVQVNSNFLVRLKNRLEMEECKILECQCYGFGFRILLLH